MNELTTPEEIEFQTEEHRLLDIVRSYPDPVTFFIPAGGATALRVRLRRALRNFVLHPSWSSSLDRTTASKVLNQYTFVADDKNHIYCGFPRRVRIPVSEPVSIEITAIKTEDVEIIKALLLLKNHDFIPFPIKIETSLPVHEIKQPYHNTEIADAIFKNHYTII